MEQHASRSERSRPWDSSGGTDVSLWEYGAAILGLLGIAALLLLAGCAGDKLNHVDGQLVAPKRVDFGRVAVGTTALHSIDVVNHGAAPVTIVAIEAGSALASTFPLPVPPKSALRAGGKATIDLNFVPTEAERSIGSLLLVTDSAEKPYIEISLFGEGVFPSVTCNQELDFGRIVLNTSAVQRITCLNNGEVDATVQFSGKDGVDSDLFTVGQNLDTNPFVIPVGETQLIEVVYTPHRLGPAEARAILEVPGAEDPTLFVKLGGVGFASDLMAAPNCLHFGAVSLGTSATRELLVVNGGTRTVSFKPSSLEDPAGVFELVSSTVDGIEEELSTLEPDEMAKLVVSFSPSGIGGYEGDLLLHNDDVTNPKLQVCLTGRGGGADLLVKPTEVDFGELALGMKVQAKVLVYNAGTDDGGPLEIKGVAVSDRDNFRVQLPTKTSLTPSDAPAEILVEFEPRQEGSFSSVLVIESNDGDEPTFFVSLKGSAATLPACSYVAIPPAIDFGTMQTGGEALLAATLRNTGADDCVFAQVEIEPGSSAAFSLPKGPIAYRVVPPGESLTLPVSFRSDKPGSARGTLRFSVSNPTAPTGKVQLRGDSLKSCLLVSPPSVTFKEQRLSCPPMTQTVQILSQCQSTARISGASLGAGAYTEGEIQVSGLSAPYDLPPGRQITLQVRYEPVDDGDDGAPFEIVSNVQSISIPIHGSGTSNDVRTDRFQQQPRASADVLFVLDNSGSMTDKQTNVAKGTSDFMRYASDQGIDFHIGVTTTGLLPSKSGWTECPGGVDGGEAGRLFPANGSRPRYVTPQTPNGAQVFANNIQVGICHWWEEGLEAAYLALSKPLVDSATAPGTPIPNDGNRGFYRPDARLSVIIVSDEEDHSARDTSFYASFFRSLKGAGREEMVSVHAVVGDRCGNTVEEGIRYKEVARATGGAVLPICTSDWGPVLAKLAEETFGFRLRFPLSGTPLSDIDVSVNGQAQLAGWRYDSAINAVLFDESSAPPPGASVDIAYVPACGT